jgi:NADH pyrophosphatase NudC (nudix superfamily)
MFDYCPQCGKKTLQFQDNRKLFCPECGFNLYHNIAAAVSVLVKSKKGYIILKRGKEPARGMLDLPGGFVDPEESAEDACRREIREEIGVEIGSLTFLGSAPNIYPYKGVTYNTCDLFFTAECLEADFRRQEEEIEDILLLRKEEIDIEQFAFDSVKHFLKNHLNKLH